MARSYVATPIAMLLGCVVTLVVWCKPPVVDMFSDAKVSKLRNATNVECVSIMDFSPKDYRVLPPSYLSFLLGRQEITHRSTDFCCISWADDGHAPVLARIFWPAEIGWERPRNDIQTHPIREVVSGSNAKGFEFNLDCRRFPVRGVPVSLASRHQDIAPELAFGGVLHGFDSSGGCVGARFGCIGTLLGDPYALNHPAHIDNHGDELTEGQNNQCSGEPDNPPVGRRFVLALAACSGGYSLALCGVGIRNRCLRCWLDLVS